MREGDATEPGMKRADAAVHRVSELPTWRSRL
jgi:hypothetical protein